MFGVQLLNMKKLLLLLLLPFTSLANPIDDKCPQFTPYGAPVLKLKSSVYLCKTNYAIQYDTGTKTAVYVLEHITKDAITGPAKRKDDFRPDPEIPVTGQSQLADYAGFPYDRGHLSPAGDNTQNDKIMSESFFLSNMVPQVPNNNRGIWKQLESNVRAYVRNFNDVYVVSGTIYDKGFTTIGLNKVGVPTRLFKVIVDTKTSKASAYIFPNQALPVADLEKFKVSIKEVEIATGINFNPKLPANATTLETNKSW